MRTLRAKTWALLGAVACVYGCDGGQEGDTPEAPATKDPAPDARGGIGEPEMAELPGSRRPDARASGDASVGDASVDDGSAGGSEPMAPPGPPPKPDVPPPAVLRSNPYATVGGGGGGALSGHLYALGTAGSVGFTDNTIVQACFVNETGDGCDPIHSDSILVPPGTRSLAAYRFDGLPDGRYILDAYRDVNGNGILDESDEIDTFAMNGLEATLLRPPVENVNLRLKPATHVARLEPALQIEDLVGSWKVSAPDAPTHNYSFYEDGQYTSIYAAGSAIANCGLVASRSEQGTASLADGIIVFQDRNASGFSGGTCAAAGEVGSGTRVYAVQLWQDEIGRPAMILRAAAGPYVDEEVFIRR